MQLGPQLLRDVRVHFLVLHGSSQLRLQLPVGLLGLLELPLPSMQLALQRLDDPCVRLLVFDSGSQSAAQLVALGALPLQLVGV
eukprot:CAMPEP_0176079118 /NCGR_PEP_ID=MMETSP0120_2-20121206/39570_1 /TAXON_ID=160619 /ORGANISM="Kryptoperidinium foliaceum, Strain CCMP 1326" /LENGTH=83 /DNA_ID=CAMNT_0017412873 /DNA_START=324 /DNA_END=575 /DNA_ORIENTATION=-